MSDVLRRKVSKAAPIKAEIDGGAEAAWGIALARALRVRAGVLAEVSAVSQTRLSLTEILETLPSLSLLAILDGPGGGLGLVSIAPDLSSALIEVQTVGHVLVRAPLPRRPTRTDGAMISPIIDAAVQELTSLIEGDPDSIWAGNFRYASFLEEPRPLNLLLDEPRYRILRADMVLPDGGRQGEIFLILPAVGRGKPVATSKPKPMVQEIDFTEALSEVVQSAPCRLETVLGRVTLPLRQILNFTEGEMLPLPDAAIDRVILEADGRYLAMARLGQHRGLRALRLTDAAHFPPDHEEIDQALVVPAQMMSQTLSMQIDAPEE